MPPSGWAAMQRIGEKSRRVAELWLSKGGRAGGGTLPTSADLPDPVAAHDTAPPVGQDATQPVIEPAKDDRRLASLQSRLAQAGRMERLPLQCSLT